MENKLKIGRLYRFLPTREELSKIWKSDFYDKGGFYEFLYKVNPPIEGEFNAHSEHFFPTKLLLLVEINKIFCDNSSLFETEDHKELTEYKFLHEDMFVYSDWLPEQFINAFCNLFEEVG